MFEQLVLNDCKRSLVWLSSREPQVGGERIPCSSVYFYKSKKDTFFRLIGIYKHNSQNVITGHQCWTMSWHWDLHSRPSMDSDIGSDVTMVRYS